MSTRCEHMTKFSVRNGSAMGSFPDLVLKYCTHRLLLTFAILQEPWEPSIDACPRRWLGSIMGGTWVPE